jgi:hypothetical protein
MINDETQDQDLQEEQKAMPADAKTLLDEVHMTVPAPPPGDEWVTDAVKAVEASITKPIDEFRTLFGWQFTALAAAVGVAGAGEYLGIVDEAVDHGADGRVVGDGLGPPV